MPKQQKNSPIISIESDAEFLANVDRLAVLKTHKSSKEAELERALQKVRDFHQPTIDAITDSINSNTTVCRNYLKKKAVQERLFKAGLKSGESSKAHFGYRLGTPSIKPLDTKTKLEQVAAQLILEDKLDFIAIKPTPAPSIDTQKVVASKLTDEQLAALGLRQTQSESFYIDLKDSVITASTRVKK